MKTNKQIRKPRWLLPAIVGVSLVGVGLAVRGDPASEGPAGPYTVIGFNDLGMHCMNEDYSDLVILPPYNTLRAQVIRRGVEPDILTSTGLTLEYSIPSNTHSADKTNFWEFTEQLFGAAIPPNVGLTGHGLSGTMSPAPNGIWEVTGIPLTPINDLDRVDPYPLGLIRVIQGGTEIARTQTVIPVSQELSCELCHGGEGISMEMDILLDHDRLHGTILVDSRPVLCAGCHEDVALGAPGLPGVSALSHAMHGAHAPRMDMVMLDNDCYACHPGIRTQCQRDVHLANGVECMDCHGTMEDVGSTARQPWLDEPRCGSCHQREEFDFEEPGRLFKDSRGHGGVYCASCHGSPHAITPAVTETDQVQPMRLQGSPGVLSDCLVCHTQMPGEQFEHHFDD